MNSIGIKKGDLVEVIAGNEKGRQGKVIQVIPKRNLVIIEGLNLRKRHQRPYGTNPGGIIEKPMPIHRSDVMLVCPKCAKKTRIRWRRREDGKRVRQCRKCGEDVE